ncbi:MAG: hypothetical protein FVQ83_11185 [Chloroflexi bacterium]|nr:hypothetical protein [Chloroflexota bacterium]
MQERLDTQLQDNIDTMETFFDGLSLSDETDTRRPSDLLMELSKLLRFPIKLSNHEQRLFKDDPDQLADQIAEQVEVFNTTQTITRSIGAVERRLEKSLDLNASELAEQDWDHVTSKIISEVEADYEKRRNQLIGDQQDGHIAKSIQSQLTKSGDKFDDEFLIALLTIMPRGERAVFDKKTHKRVLKRTTRLTYVYFAAQLLQGIKTEKITQMVMEHLDAARVATQQAWGIHNWERLEKERFIDIDKKIQAALSDVLSGSAGDYAERLLEDIVNGEKEQVIDALGRHSLTLIYRELLLRVISELWVDYLTRIEALRISIGLEAYAQRDPLVQYKAKAFELFQNLFSDMRISLVNRMFVFQPRNIKTAQATTSAVEIAEQPVEDEAQPTPKSAKRKRRRRRKKKKKN